MEAPVYSANIILPDMEFHAIPVSGNNLGAIDMLIGMDIISMGDFHISNHVGRTVMTFRMPSLEKLDYCEELRDARRYRKIHKSWIKHGNKLCPCGSGKPWRNATGFTDDTPTHTDMGKRCNMLMYRCIGTTMNAIPVPKVAG